MRAEEMLRGLPLKYAANSTLLSDVEVADVITSPKTVSKNCIYVVVKTPVRDGYYGVEEAYSAGCRIFITERMLTTLPGRAAIYMTEDAKALLGELAARCYGDPSRSLRVFGITGTHGKSSVALILGELLRQSGRRVSVLTGDGADDGAGFVPAGSVAPNAADICRFLHRSALNGAEFAILEFSAYQLVHSAAVGITFDAVLLTDFEPHHIGSGMHRNVAAYTAAKAALFSTKAARAFLPAGPLPFTCSVPTVIYGETGEVFAKEITPRIEERGVSFTLCRGGDEVPVFHPVLGDFAVDNALAASALALHAGLSLTEVAAGLGTATPIGRLEPVALLGGRAVYLDVAYTGEDVEKALRALRAVTVGQLTVLLGAVGGRAKARRRACGRAAGEFSDFVWFTTDDPDDESPEHILADLLEDWPRHVRYAHIPDRREAIAAAVAELHPGDTLLVLGKAREETQLICGKRHPFSDRDEIRRSFGCVLDIPPR